MATGKNNGVDENEAPKKADVLIMGNQEISYKQDEVIRQTKLAVSRTDAALELFSKNIQDTAVLAKQNADFFEELKNENSALRQELLYLAKQSENIYAGLSEKMSELNEQAKNRELAYGALADKINDVSEQTKLGQDVYSDIVDKINDLTEQTKHSELVYSELADKVSDLTEQSKRNESMYTELSDRMEVISAQTLRSEGVFNEIEEKLAALNEIDEKLSTINELDEKLAPLSELDEKLATLNTLDEKLAAISELDEKLAALDGLEEKLATLSELDEKLKVFNELDDKLTALNELDEKLTALDELDEKLKVVNELDDKLKVISELDEKLAALNTLDEKIDDVTEQGRRNENAYNRLTDRVEVLSMRVERIGDEASTRIIAAPVLDTAPVQTVVREEIDYDALAEKVASAVSAREVISPDYIASKVAEQVIFPDRDGANVTLSLDEEIIAKHVADYIALTGVKVASDEVAPVEPVVQPAPVEIDEDSLAEKIASKIGTVNIDEENIADKIAGKITTFTVDEDNIAERIADRINTLNIDGDNLADKIALKVNTLNLDEEELADRIALKVGSLKAEDFEILVDDEGCSSISKEITDKLDYNSISQVISEKLTSVLELAELNAPDYEEMAQRISEKITVAGINEDAIADKAAAVLSNYLPEIDADDISEKVTSAVIDLLNAQAQDTHPVVDIDNDTICNTISERLIESQADHDYDIVIDEDGISKITELVSEEIERGTGERFAKIDESITEIKEKLTESLSVIKDDIKEMLESGVVVSSTSNEIATAEAAYEPADTVEEELVTVSDLVKPEDIQEEVADEEAEEDDEEAIEQIEDDMSDGEALFAHSGPGGVDFENMMKYNRSFIARIIQGTDEQKQYYGAVKQALLSYKKVNSNIAWAAERFNKGRETIARLKIRGKTLCLYLALDPNDYKASVYHHANVIDNKSMNGTPMMVKIKSPLGVKKAIRLIDEMLEKRDGVKRKVPERDYAAMYPYETIEELIEDGLVKDVQK